MSTHKVIIDCDPGHDDAIALLVAAAAPELDIAAVTTVAGNQTVEKTTRNARRVCALAGIDAPIAAGAHRPLIRELITASVVHGETGLDGPSPDGPLAPLDPRHAVDLIIDTLTASIEPVTLIALAPMTNIALALRLRPAIADRIAGICLMGGAAGTGNQTPSAEFNMFVDPEAARIVFESGIPIRMAGLELTSQAGVTDAIMDRIAETGTPRASFVHDLLVYYRRTIQARHGHLHAPIHDAVAVAWVADPSLVLARSMHVAVETHAEFSAGRTLCDSDGLLGRPANAEVGIRLDASRFWDRLFRAVATETLAAR